jgi:hypothetical protein
MRTREPSKRSRLNPAFASEFESAVLDLNFVMLFVGMGGSGKRSLDFDKRSKTIHCDLRNGQGGYYGRSPGFFFANACDARISGAAHVGNPGASWSTETIQRLTARRI